MLQQKVEPRLSLLLLSWQVMDCCSTILDQKDLLIHLHPLLKWVCLSSGCLRCQVVSGRPQVQSTLAFLPDVVLLPFLVASSMGYRWEHLNWTVVLTHCMAMHSLTISDESDQLRPVIWSFCGNMPSLRWPLGFIASIGPESIPMRPLGISCQHGPFT